MKKKVKALPKFKNEDEEREFWATHSPLDYLDAKAFKSASSPNLKPGRRATFLAGGLENG